MSQKGDTSYYIAGRGKRWVHWKGKGRRGCIGKVTQYEAWGLALTCGVVPQNGSSLRLVQGDTEGLVQRWDGIGDD